MSVHESLLSRIEGALVVDIPASISCDGLMELSSTLLNHLEYEDVDAVVINVQQLTVAETILLQTLNKMLKMIQIMGVPAAVVGMQAGLITALVHLDMHIDNICFAKDVQRAIRQLKYSGRGSQQGSGSATSVAPTTIVQSAAKAAPPVRAESMRAEQ